MFPSKMIRSWLSVVGGLAAAAALLLATVPASAQQPGYPPSMGNTKMWPWNVGYAGPRETATRPAALTPPPVTRRSPAYVPPHWDGTLLVTVTRRALPQTPAPLIVNLRGPDGVVRSYPLAGSPEAIQRREVIVRPGESTTINVIGTARAK
jgi:hypothetical protein